MSIINGFFFSSGPGNSAHYEYDNEYDNAYGQGNALPANRHGKGFRTLKADPVLTSAEKQTEDGDPESDSDEFSDESSSVEEKVVKTPPVSQAFRGFKLEASSGIRTDTVQVSDPTLIHQRENQPLDKSDERTAGDDLYRFF